MKVKLSYFKTTGKWYSDAEYTSDNKALYQIWADVDQMLCNKQLPGLIEGHSEFIVLVDVPDHPHRHPHLILPPSLEEYVHE